MSEQKGYPTRAERRAAAQATAKLLVKGISEQEGVRTKDIALWCSAGVMAIGLYLAPEKTPLWVVCGLGAMAALAAHPVLHMPWIVRMESRAKRISWKCAAMSAMLALIGLYGWFVWPPIRRHVLDAIEKSQFEDVLKKQNGKDITIQIACPSLDEKACIYAQQFVNLFGESDWNIQPLVTRITTTRALDGVTVHRRGGNKQDMEKRWNAGGWFNLNEPHLLAVQSAFRGIHIEIDGGTNPDLAEDVMEIYVGSEKENEGKPNDLTRSTDWATGKRTGKFPVPQ